jgi:hypothetical protein
LKGVPGKLLQPRVTFEYKDAQAINELPGTQAGMIAQEVERVFPQWVDEGADGYNDSRPSLTRRLADTAGP